LVKSFLQLDYVTGDDPGAGGVVGSFSSSHRCYLDIRLGFSSLFHTNYKTLPSRTSNSRMLA